MNNRFIHTLVAPILVFTILLSGCGFSSRPTPAEKPSVQVAAPEPTPPSKTDLFREIEKMAKEDPDIGALDAKLENFRILRRFWVAEKARAERPNRRLTEIPQAKSSKERLAEAQRRNLYESNLARERAIVMDEYIRRLDEEIVGMENGRSELIVQKIDKAPEK